VKFDHDFNEKNDAKIILSIHDSVDVTNYYYLDKYLLGFIEEGLNEWQTGLYNFEVSGIPEKGKKYITLVVRSGNQENVLKNLRINYLKYR
jgi:hypothetical protein